MKISVVAVGKCKEKYWNEAIAEYTKRLRRYAPLEIIEVPDEKTPDGASEAEERQIKAREGERILKKLRDDAYVIALAIEGESPDSVALSRELDRLAVSGCGAEID